MNGRRPIFTFSSLGLRLVVWGLLSHPFSATGGQVEVRLFSAENDVSESCATTTSLHFIGQDGISIACRPGQQCGLNVGSYEVFLECAEYVMAVPPPHILSDKPAPIADIKFAIPVKRSATLELQSRNYQAGVELQVLDVLTGVSYFFDFPQKVVAVPSSKLIYLLKRRSGIIVEMSRPFLASAGSRGLIGGAKPHKDHCRLFFSLQHHDREHAAPGRVKVLLQSGGVVFEPDLVVSGVDLRSYYFWFDAPQAAVAVRATDGSGLNDLHEADLRGKPYFSMFYSASYLPPLK